MRDKLRNNLELKINIINCLCENLIEETNRLREIKEDEAKENIHNRDNVYDEAVGLVAYIEALKDITMSIDLCREGYIDSLIDNYESDIRELEPDIVEPSNIQDDIFEDGIDYTCYPLDIEESTPENIPF